MKKGKTARHKNFRDLVRKKRRVRHTYLTNLLMSKGLWTSKEKKNSVLEFYDRGESGGPGAAGALRTTPRATRKLILTQTKKKREGGDEEPWRNRRRKKRQLDLIPENYLV